MKQKHACGLIGISMIVMIIMNVPAIIINQKESGMFLATGIDSSQLPNEDLQVIVAMADNFDVNEKIYIGIAGIRNAKATYIKPSSIKVDLVSNEFEQEFIISNHYGQYDGVGNWNEVPGREVKRYNDFIYYTTFAPFGYDAILTARVTMVWTTPWHEPMTTVEEKVFTVGTYYNISASVAAKQRDVRSSVLDKVNLGVDFAVDLIEDVSTMVDSLSRAVDQIQSMINAAEIDPANLNFYIVDLAGTSVNKGPMYDLARDDLYGPAGDAQMTARHTFIMNSIRDSLTVLDDKLGPDHSPTDGTGGYGNYSYTVTFVRRMYETYAPDNSYVNPADSVDSLVAIGHVGYSDENGNVTGSDWTSAYDSGFVSQHDVSLEFLLESSTGDHIKFKDVKGASWNERPVRKAVVINTMGPYWPIFNSWYQYHERTIADRPAPVQIPVEKIPSLNSSYGTRLAFSDQNILTNIRRIVLDYDITAVDGGSSNLTSKNDMFDPVNPARLYYGFNIVNYTYFMKKMADGMADHFYYWVNLGGGRPFSKMTRDIGYDFGGGILHYFSSHVMSVILELSGNVYKTTVDVAGVLVVVNPSFKVENYFNKTMFELVDWFARITNDRYYFNTEALPIGSTNTEYYKIDSGRWVDAFFNGTDLSERDGSLHSANYITARETVQPWKSAKAPNYSFKFEDTWAFYRLGKLDGYKAPNEYAWTCFMGPNPQVPCGWMTSPSMWYSVVGTDDVRMALEYLYGGIFMGYKETVLGYKNIATTLILAATEGTAVPEAKLNYLMKQVTDLDSAWAYLDLQKIDKIGQNIMNSMTERDATTKQTIPQQVVQKIANRTALAYLILSKDQPQYSSLDTGLNTAGSDLQPAGVGEILNDLIINNIGPTLEKVQAMITNLFATINSIKKSAFNTSLGLANNAFGYIEHSVSSITDAISGVAKRTEAGFKTVGDTMINFAGTVNSTLHSLTNGIVDWTAGQIQAVGTETQRRFGELGTFINGTVFDTIEGISSNIRNGLVSITDGVQTFSNNVITGIKNASGMIAKGITSVCEAGGGVIGTALGGAAGFVLGGPIGGAVGMGAGALLGTMAGGSIGKGVSNFISTPLNLVTNYMQTSSDRLYDGIRGTIDGAYAGVQTLISGARAGAQTVLTGISGAIGVVTDRSIQFTNDLGRAVNGATSFGTGIVQDFGREITSFGANVASGITTATGSAELLADRALSWSKSAFQKMMEADVVITTTMLYTLKASISNTLSLVKLVLQILKEVSEVLENLVKKINEAFTSVGALFTSVGNFLVDLAGKTVDLAVNFAGDLAQQLTVIESQIKASTGFYANMGGLFEQIKASRTAASLIKYAEQTMGTDKSIFYKWADVVAPISNAKGGDSSFRVIQMGSSFADRLHFLVMYRGSPVNADDITVTASRPPNPGESVPGNFLKATIPAYAARYDNGTRVNGLYYASFNTTTEYEWYGSGPDPVKVEPAQTGDYLVRADAIYTTPISSPHHGAIINNTWMERTTLYSAEYTNDAFPVMRIISSYTSPITAGTTQSLRVAIKNEMYSKPSVSIGIDISTNDGFVISSRTIANAQLPSSDDGEHVFDFQWTPLASTPGGSYNMLVIVTEANGDTATRIVPVQITATTIFGDILGWIIGIFSSLLGGLGLGAFIVNRRRSSASGLLQSTSLSSPRQLPLTMKKAGSFASCTPKDLREGTCMVNLNCDPKTGECKINF